MNKGASTQITIVLCLLLIGSFQMLLEDVSVSALPDDPNADRLLRVNGALLIEDFQVWGQVDVTPGSRLVVSNGGHLVTSTITLGKLSTLDIRSGIVEITNRTWTPRVGIFGECDRLIVTHHSLVTIRGPDGAYDLATSMGADAGIDLVVARMVRIETSTIQVRGGEGLSAPEPLTSGDLTGDEFSGGDAYVRLRIEDPDPIFSVRDAGLDIAGGRGGDAPDGGEPAVDGAGGRGGGLTRGGDVAGTVARGGDVELSIASRSVDLSSLVASLVAGNGGDAGDGGDSLPGPGGGGGGGGYSGGDGAHAEADITPLRGGAVSGEVGAGGDASMLVEAEQANVTGSSIVLQAGHGGAGGDGGASAGTGGGGGGGYSGGGGGSRSMAGGNGGPLSGSVASGGEAGARFSANGYLNVRNTQVTARGGEGGASGQGGDVTSSGGGGGGGCSGGGGGAGSPSGDATDGGDGGQVGGSVASGGEADVLLEAYSTLVLDSQLRARAGQGGPEGGVGGHPEGDEPAVMGGVGGGGRSSGGGAGKATGGGDDGLPGSGGTVTEGVGAGGPASMSALSEWPCISRSSMLVASPGLGGEPLGRIPGWHLEGYSVSGDGFAGDGHLHIPASFPLQVSPDHKEQMFQTPRLQWVQVHDATTEGEVTGYILTVDYDADLSSPTKVLETPAGWQDLPGMDFGVIYWAVRAVFHQPATGMTSLGPASPIRWFNFYNAPPRFYMKDPVSVLERELASVDLGPHVSDPDTEFENLTVTSPDPVVVSVDGLVLTLLCPTPQDLLQVRFSLSDGYNIRWFNLPVRVIDVNDPPVIVSVGGMEPPVVIEVDEGAVVFLPVVVEDRDGEEVDLDMYTSWQDLRLFSNGTLRVMARRGLLGDRTAKLVAEDPRRGLTSLRITIRVRNVPDPPTEVAVYGPMDGSVHKQYDPVTFTVKVSDPDLVWGERVNVTWTSDISGHLATRETGDIASFTTTDLPVGAHVITIRVDDGTYEATTQMRVTVKERPPPPDPDEPVEGEVPLYIFALLVIMPLLGYAIGFRGVTHGER